MNKISKKIVALATMAAFVLTLVPAAAFAAVEPTDSYVSLAEDNVDVDTPVAIYLKTADGNNVTPGTELGEKIYVWAEKVDGETSTPTRDVEYTVNDAAFTGTGQTTYLSNGLAAIVDSADDLNKLSVKFTAAGDYVVKAGVSFSEATPTSTSDIVTFVGEKNAITVDAAAVGDVDKLTFNGNETTKDKITLDPIKDNNTATKTYTVKAFIGGTTPAANETFTIEADSGLTVTAKDPISGEAFDAGTVTTNRKGEFQLTYSANRAGNLKIYITSEDGYLVTATVKAGEVTGDYPANIETTLENGQTLNVEGKYTNYVDAVQFAITDQNGDAVTGPDAIESEPATKGNTDYVKVLVKPTKFKEQDNKAAFKLVWNSDKEVYTLAPTVGTTLVEGDYTVRVALLETGNYADASFTVDKFGKATGIKIKFTSKNVTDENQVALDADVKGKVVLVDANGIEEDATNTTVSVGYTGTAVDADPAPAMTAQNISFSVKDATTDEEALKLVGTPITITAINEAKGFIDQVTLTVVDKANTEGTSLSFNSDNGPARENNNIAVQVVNSDDEAIKNIDNGTMYAFVDSQTNADAHIELTPATTISNGKGTLKVYSDKETKADIVVAIRDNATNKIYAKTLTYTFGAADVNADKLVAMTIGSSDYIVDNDVVAGDAAPYIDSAWRTMVPIRVLAETFGATVDFDNDTQTITIVDGDTTIVMTVGETAYTVNDEEANMDTAPVIGEGDRTFVPVRFVAEALGYTVTPLQDANGLTASVVFQK